MLPLYTIGHSNHPLDKFLELISQLRIDVVVDIRSVPSSGYSPQFGGPELSRSLQVHGFRYLFLGRELGGRPENPAFYDDEGYVLYEPLSQSGPFQAGIERLLHGAIDHRIALLCGEEDPISCHRRRLVAPILLERGLDVLHARGDGRVQEERELQAIEQVRFPDRYQLHWMATVAAWRSTKPAPIRSRVAL